MKIVLSLLVFVLIPLTVHSSEPTCSKAAREKDAQCGTYCLQVVKPLLNYASSVRAKEDQFAKLQTKISEQKAQLANQIELSASCQRNIASKDAFIANLQSQIKSKESQIGEKDKQINNLQSQLKNNELNINEKVGEVSKLKSVIKDKDVEIANIASLKETIKQKEFQLNQLIEFTASYKSNIASKEALIANLRSQVKSKESQTGEKDKQINNLQSQLKNNELNINEKVGEVSKLKSVIKDKDVEIENIASLKETIKQKELQLNQQIELTASKDTFIANLQSQIKSKDSQIGEKDKQISSLQSQQKDYELIVVKNYQLESRLTECKDMCLASSCLRKLTDIYTIKVPDIEPFSVPCDSNLAGNGWTVFTRRMDGSEDFYRTWDEYKAGFGNLRREFFLGLEKLHLLTKSQPHELYIHLEGFESETYYAKYSHFVIGNEEEAYEIIKLGDYSGNAGDLMVEHLNMKFTTKDRDNDKLESDNCATLFEYGWWFRNCSWCNLTERYCQTKPLKFIQMIRPKST